MNRIKDFFIRRNLTLFDIVAMFVIFAFFGWIFETLVVRINFNIWTNRGFLFIGPKLVELFPSLSNVSWLKDAPIVWGLPLIDMYGYGGVLVVVLLKRFKDSGVKLFFVGAISMTIFELLGSYFTDLLFQKQFWSYAHEPFNFQGRICLQSTIGWGLLSVFAIHFVEPILMRFVKGSEKHHRFKVFIYFIFVYAIACTLIKYFLYPDVFTIY